MVLAFSQSLGSSKKISLQSTKMPRGNLNFNGSFGGGKRYGLLSAEEAAGIVLLVVVLAVLVIIGWCYYKRRSGYKSLLSKNFGMMKTREGNRALLDSKFPLQEFNSDCHPMVPDAPPAYDKISTKSKPPPYAP